MYDCDFSGKREDPEKVCFHRRRVIKMVTFEGTDTGRKYLGCHETLFLILLKYDFEHNDHMLSVGRRELWLCQVH